MSLNFPSVAKLLELQPENPSVQYHVAHCFQTQGLWAEAERLFRSAAKSEKYQLAAMLGAGICLLHLKKPDEAVKAFGDCLEKAPDHEQALLGRGVSLQLMWDFDGATESYRRILAKNPRSSKSRVNMITLGMQRKDPGVVRDFSRRLLELDANSEPGLEGSVFAAFSHEEFHLAADGCRRLVQLHPDRFDHWNNLGVALQNSGQPDASERAYRRALDLRSESEQAFVNLGVGLQDSDRLPEALEVFDKALEKAPDREDLRLRVALLVVKQGKLEDAESRYLRLVEKSPTLSYVWFRLGYLQLNRGSNEAAAKAFGACLRLRPEWPEAETNLDLAQWRLQNYEVAEAVLDELVDREPKDLDVIRGLASVCLSHQNAEKAHYYHERLTELGDRGAEILYNRDFWRNGSAGAPRRFLATAPRSRTTRISPRPSSIWVTSSKKRATAKPPTTAGTRLSSCGRN